MNSINYNINCIIESNCVPKQFIEDENFSDISENNKLLNSIKSLSNQYNWIKIYQNTETITIKFYFIEYEKIINYLDSKLCNNFKLDDIIESFITIKVKSISLNVLLETLVNESCNYIDIYFLSYNDLKIIEEFKNLKIFWLNRLLFS